MRPFYRVKIMKNQLSGVKKNSCSICKYFRKQIDPNNVAADQGTCLRYPPVSQLVPTAQGIATATSTPITKGTDWCGEFYMETAIAFS